MLPGALVPGGVAYVDGPCRGEGRVQTQTSFYAAKHAANLAKQSLRTIWIVRWCANLILAIGIGVSTPHQANYLMDRGMDQYSAWLIPISADLLAAICVKVLSTAAIQALGRWSAGGVLLFPLGVSGLINYLAPGELLVRYAFVVPVLMIPAAEFVASRIRPNFKRLDAMERELAPADVEPVPVVVEPVPAVEPVVTEEAPVPIVKTERKKRATPGTTRTRPLAEPGVPMPPEREAIEATLVPPSPYGPAFSGANGATR